MINLNNHISIDSSINFPTVLAFPINNIGITILIIVIVFFVLLILANLIWKYYNGQWILVREAPYRAPEGYEWVLVNGRWILRPIFNIAK